MSRKEIEINIDELKEAIKISYSKSDISRNLKLVISSSVFRKYDKLIKENNINISHFDKCRKNRLRKKYEIIKKICPVCKQKFKTKKNHKREKVTCSHSCSNTYFRSSKTSIYRRNRFTVKCKNCDKELKIGRSNRKFCNNTCRQELEYKVYIENWQVGKEDGIKASGLNVSNYIRRYIWKKYEGKCSKCSWNEINLKTNKSPLQIDHINGNPIDNREENLQLLCPNCYALTETYGNSKNKGKGRVVRMLRYKFGKSW